MLNNFKILAAVLLSASVIACNDVDEPVANPDAGQLSLRVKVGDNAIDVIDFTISGPASPDIVGSIDVSGADVAAFQQNGIPVGDGYVLTLAAETVDGLQKCNGTSPTFAILPNATTSLKVALNCEDKEVTDPDTSTDSGTGTETSSVGNLDVEIVPNQKPRIAALSASPDESGTTFVFSAMVSDTDGDALSYLWQVDDLDISTAESSSYVCAVSGEHTVSLQVSDAKVPVDDSLVFVCN